jgi:hypothetical protein
MPLVKSIKRRNDNLIHNRKMSKETESDSYPIYLVCVAYVELTTVEPRQGEKLAYIEYHTEGRFIDRNYRIPIK